MVAQSCDNGQSFGAIKLIQISILLEYLKLTGQTSRNTTDCSGALQTLTFTPDELATFASISLELPVNLRVRSGRFAQVSPCGWSSRN